MAASTPFMMDRPPGYRGRSKSWAFGRFSVCSENVLSMRLKAGPMALAAFSGTSLDKESLKPAVGDISVDTSLKDSGQYPSPQYSTTHGIESVDMP